MRTKFGLEGRTSKLRGDANNLRSKRVVVIVGDSGHTGSDPAGWTYDRDRASMTELLVIGPTLIALNGIMSAIFHRKAI
jgi:hypothetical protein